MVVAGGGAAGIAAAAAAAAAGASVLLVERTPALGGAATQRNVAGYCGLFTCRPDPVQAVGGIASQVLRRLRERAGVSNREITTEHDLAVVYVDPEAVKVTLDEIVREAGVDVLLGAMVSAAHRDRDELATVTILDFGGRMSDVTAGAYVDATGDANLAALSGAAVTGGNGGRTQTATLGVRYGGISPDADVSPATVQAAVEAARRDCPTLRLTSSVGYLFRLPTSGDLVTYLADEDVDALDPIAYATATVDARAQAWSYLEVIRSLPGADGAFIASTGPELGIRESRHLVTVQPLKDDWLTGGIVPADSVALAAWPAEHHGGRGLASDWTRIGGEGAYGVVLDQLRSADTRNLFGAGRVMGGGMRAGASVRVMGTCFATGQAAGVAAARWAAAGERGLLDAARTELGRQEAILALP
ncbi:FAD-dependent oxidoreductase [Actinoplanes sp. NPDC049265]|uniref:FAD-dependent oxidoreductase n=1 Tax=Actinoplanes sp. NPDC049265 TaxID=3363902 RepID=UPI0037221365